MTTWLLSMTAVWDDGPSGMAESVISGGDNVIMVNDTGLPMRVVDDMLSEYGISVKCTNADILELCRYDTVVVHDDRDVCEEAAGKGSEALVVVKL